MNALGTLGKLAQKPSDKKIRTWRIVFALLLAASIAFGLFGTDVNVSIFDYKIADIPYDEYILLVLFFFPLVGLVRGIFDPGLFKKSVWKKVITGLGLAMMIISVFFISEKAYHSQNIIVGEITAESLSNQNNDIKANFAKLPTDNLLFFFGLITTFVGFFLTGKNLTTKNEKFGETIKKIRV